MTVSRFFSNLKTSDLISFLALIIASISIFWNIYRDILLKAKLKVSVRIDKILQQDRSRSLGPFLSIYATNHGPGEIICVSIWMLKRTVLGWLRRKNILDFIKTDTKNQFSSKLPMKLSIGENIHVLLPYKRDIFLAERPTAIGVMDSFGRIHWTDKKSMRKVIKQYFKDFPEKKINKSKSNWL